MEGRLDGKMDLGVIDRKEGPGGGGGRGVGGVVSGSLWVPLNMGNPVVTGTFRTCRNCGRHGSGHRQNIREA